MHGLRGRLAFISFHFFFFFVKRKMYIEIFFLYFFTIVVEYTHICCIKFTVLTVLTGV